MSQMMDLGGKVAVVTGASRGIGEACARRLDAKGARVAMVARSTAAMEAIAADLVNEPLIITADLSKEIETSRAASQVLATIARIDFLVNNVGLGWNEPPEAITAKRLDLQLTVNVRNVILLTTQLLPSLIDRQGSVVNISSAAAEGGGPEQAVYAATKGAINSYTRNLARALGPRGVRANGVAPGLIDTEMWAPLIAKVGEAELKDGYADQVPLRRWGSADEVASVVCFLCSSAASYITGQIIKVDGGIH
jgi:3-oxoacyl-[acyl-carrier protein] reductase